VERAPAHSFAEQDAPDLAALDLDALLTGSSGQRIQTPLWLLLRLGGAQLVPHLDELARWDRAGQGNDDPPLLLGKSRLASGTRAIAQAIQALSIEADYPFPDCLGMTSELLGDGGRALPLPAAYNHLGASDPISWGMATAGQLADLLLFLRIKR